MEVSGFVLFVKLVFRIVFDDRTASSSLSHEANDLEVEMLLIL